MAALPKTFRKIGVNALRTDFRAAVSIETVDMCEPKDKEICIRNKYVGINTTDMDMCEGKYEVVGKFPLNCGYEGIGEVVKVGRFVTTFKEGDFVGYLGKTSYTEYICLPATREVYKIPALKPEYLVLLVSGLTAAIGLDKNARITQGESVLITEADGGTGHIAVQWAKANECHVIGLCSTEDKVPFLKDLGCDRVINYTEEDLKEVLPQEYPHGVNVIWNTLGGALFLTFLRNLAIKGRLIVLRGVSYYKEEDIRSVPRGDLTDMPERLVHRSAAVQGYLLYQYTECYKTYLQFLIEKFESGKLKALYDLGENEEFTGIEKIVDAVEYLQSGKGTGKVLVKLY